jgi:hypothetical protein
MNHALLDRFSQLLLLFCSFLQTEVNEETFLHSIQL